jgi:hypothetical protein
MHILEHYDLEMSKFENYFKLMVFDIGTSHGG